MTNLVETISCSIGVHKGMLANDYNGTGLTLGQRNTCQDDVMSLAVVPAFSASEKKSDLAGFDHKILSITNNSDRYHIML